MLPHAIYYDTLGSITDESSDQWKATVAGLFVLRLVDDWLDFGPHIAATDVTGLAAVDTAISHVSAGNPVQALLGRIVKALREAESATITAIAPPLLAYAQALEYEGLFSLEEEVLMTLHAYAKAADDSQTILTTSLRLGIVSRNAGRFDLAKQYHTAAADLAYAMGDIANALLARLGCAKTTAVRGDLGIADAMCASVVEDARKSGPAHMLGRALHDRAYMAYLRDDHQGTIRYAYQALEHMEEPRLRDRVMADMASAFLKIGHVAAARDTNLILASCAQEQIIRWQATMGLMYAAMLEHQEDMFELHRAAMGCVELPPWDSVYYHWTAGIGLRHFGYKDRAEKELQEAHGLAEKYQMQKLVFDLEQELAQTPSGIWEEDIDFIAHTIGEQRQFYALAGS
jgi:hypothetical protein